MAFKKTFAKLKGRFAKKTDRAPSTQREREERSADRAARAEARHVLIIVLSDMVDLPDLH